MGKIRYSRLSGGSIAVYYNDGLKDRRAGTIITLPNKGYQYRAGGPHRGRIFKTIDGGKAIT